MATRSHIIVRRTAGDWASVYCHRDGQPEGVGARLQEFHNWQDRVEELVALGDLSSLGKYITQPEGHTFDRPVPDYSVAYGRDRGEAKTGAKIADSLAAVWPGTDTGAEYIYVWRDGTWWVGDADEGQQSLRVLAGVLSGADTPPTPNVKAFGGNFVLGTRKKTA